MNKYAFNLIKQFEGCKLTTYHDLKGVPTIAYGHTGKDVLPGLTITQEQADNLLIADLSIFEAGVKALAPSTLSEGCLGALIDFAYNVGLHNLASSTLLKLIKAGNLIAAADQFLLWDHVNGSIIAGLERRRQAERQLFLNSIPS